MSRPICFLSDFGHSDEFVGVVHGVIGKLSPEVRVIDITHGIPRGDVRAGALAITRAIQYLPEGVLLAVVDPGVGTERRAVAAETGWGQFVGPDNGLLGPAVAMLGGASRVVAIENPEVRIPSAGATFQGRDVFAPAAALLASGEAALEELGPDVDPAGLVPLLLPLPHVEPSTVMGEAWWVDGFGNVQTNIGPDDLQVAGLRLGDPVELVVGGTSYSGRWVRTYAEVDEGDLAVHIDSSGMVALAIRGGRADDGLNLGVGRAVTLRAGRGSPKPG